MDQQGVVCSCSLEKEVRAGRGTSPPPPPLAARVGKHTLAGPMRYRLPVVVTFPIRAIRNTLLE